MKSAFIVLGLSLGFEIGGFGFGVSGLGFRGVEFGVQDLRFVDQD
eukprot:CAMPEP_0184305926 /NCGR_PEP_ID=MMETSP1049-20130417/15062_1 /TAXON_ID=77928 /ORGANISM="Proteomonas sulcata, Strain CCMP704" /LENGTH=44 /DNA_ID= /DNA_START= /DNA_END= /DNA_ORIENTATION=